MPIDPLLTLLRQKARYSHQELADLLSLTEAEVDARITEFEANGTILGYQTVIDPDLSGNTDVSAFIEVRLTPERGGGFDRLAMRIAKFDQVESCYLISGGYDLNVVVVGADLREVARFVSEKLSTINGVVSTATHFKLKTYKQNSFIYDVEEPEGRLSVSP
jgi:DNA-binding Lrp family transcriptional regulator